MTRHPSHRLGASLSGAVAGLVLGMTSACAVNPPTADAASSAAPIRALIGDAACESDAQCHTIGIGAKACGGPDAYLAWSSLRTDAQRIKDAAAKQIEARRKELMARGAVSTCSVLPDPGAYCAAAAASGAARVCTLRARGAGGVKVY
jgi:hypothetical protein